MNPTKELSHYLYKMNIEHEYQNDGNIIVIDFAEKPDNSEYPINYKIFEITYSSEKECFIIELTSTMNIKQYPKLHLATYIINREYKLADTQNKLVLNASIFKLASLINQYIQASTLHVTLFDQLQNI